MTQENINQNSKNLYFKRQIELWGEDAQETLAQKSILIVGCGGLGSSISIALGSSGIGRIDLLDFDKVSIHNIHRQIGFGLEDEDFNKAEILAKLLKSKSNYTQINSFDIDFETFTHSNIINNLSKKYDLIIDATDNMKTRAMINRFAKSIDTPWLYGSVEEFNGYVCLFDEADFEDTFKITDKKPKGVACPIVMQIASLQANIAIRYLLDMKVAKDKLYYCYYDSDGDYCVQKYGI
jgi:adenylyltransferase/sulfurtransferase